MDDFDADPFDKNAPQLRFPQSGVITSSEVLENLQYALEEREKKSDDLLEKRLFSKELPLKESKGNKKQRLNLATTPINITNTCSNAVEMERNALAMVIDSAEKNDLIAIKLVLVKRISEEYLTVPCKKLQRASGFSRFQDSLWLKFLQHMSALMI